MKTTSKKPKTNRLAKYGITKAIISVHAGRDRFNHAHVFLRRTDETTLIELTAQRHRMDLPDMLGSTSLYPEKPKDHDRPEAPFDFGPAPYSAFYALKLAEVHQRWAFDAQAFERAAKVVKSLSTASTADEVREGAPRCDLVVLVRVLKVLNVPIEYVLTLEGDNTTFSPETMPYEEQGKAYRYWSKARGEEVPEPTAVAVAIEVMP